MSDPKDEKFENFSKIEAKDTDVRPEESETSDDVPKELLDKHPALQAVDKLYGPLIKPLGEGKPADDINKLFTTVRGSFERLLSALEDTKSPLSENDRINASVSVGNIYNTVLRLKEYNLDQVPTYDYGYYLSNIMRLGWYAEYALVSLTSEDRNSESIRRRLRDILYAFDKNAANGIEQVIQYFKEEAERNDSVTLKASRILGVDPKDLLEAKRRVEQGLREAETTIGQVKLVASGTGFNQFSNLFDQEARKHLADANSWRWGVIIVSGVLLATAVLIFYSFGNQHLELSRDTNVAAALILVTPRLLVASALLYTMVFCARNYRLSLHNYVVNKHRSIAMLTFELFAKSAGDEPTKSAVLLKMLDSILSIHSSGFYDQGKDNIDDKSPMSQAIDLITILGKQK